MRQEKESRQLWQDDVVELEHRVMSRDQRTCTECSYGKDVIEEREGDIHIPIYKVMNETQPESQSHNERGHVIAGWATLHQAFSTRFKHPLLVSSIQAGVPIAKNPCGWSTSPIIGKLLTRHQLSLFGIGDDLWNLCGSSFDWTLLYHFRCRNPMACRNCLKGC